MSIFSSKNQHRIDDCLFSASATSSAVFLDGNVPIALVIPASFGQTVINFQHSVDGTTYYDVYNDVGVKVVATVSATAESWTDITGVFPASCGGYVKLVTGGSVTKAVKLVTRNV